MNRLLSLIAWMTYAAHPGAIAAQNNNSQRPDTPQARIFFRQLQKSFEANDRKGVANAVEYPMLTTLHGRKIRIRDRALLLRHYDQIFDKGVRCAILGSTDKDVWGNSHGFSIEYNGTTGTIWFEGFRAPKESGFTYRLMTVNNGPENKCVAR